MFSGHIIITRREDDGNTGGDEVCNGEGRSGGITAHGQGNNRRATGGFSIFSNPVNSGNAVLNVGVSTKTGSL